MPEPRLPDPFDGRPITKVTTSIKGAGDGLSKALATDAMTLHHGDKLTAVLDVVCVATKVSPLDAETPEGPQQVQYELKATGRATFVDSALQADVDNLLDAQERRNAEHRGTPALPDVGTIPTGLAPGDDGSAPSPSLGVPHPPTDDGTPTDADGYADPELAKADGAAKKATKPRKRPAKKAPATAGDAA